MIQPDYTHSNDMRQKQKPLPILTESQQQRFWSKVDKNGNCWEWMAYTDKKEKYGHVNICRTVFKAHRIAYYISTGIDPLELLVCHTCDNRKCCNPNHMFLGTNQDNIIDAAQKNRLNHAGESNSHAVLTEKDVIEIRQLYPQYTQAQIAEMYGVDQTSISRVVLRQTWA